MNHFITSEKLKWGLIIGTTIIAGDYLIRLAWRYYKKRQLELETLPTEWIKVGEVSDLICYPIRLGWIKLDEFDFNQLGVGMGRAKDRTIMFVNEKYNPVANASSNLIEIVPDYKASENLDVMMMTLSLPEIEAMQVNMEALSKTVVVDLAAWNEMKKVSDAGGDVSEWFSKFILEQNPQVKIVQFSPEIATHDARGKYKFFEATLSKESVACRDNEIFTLINGASLEGESTPISYHPNIVVKGPKAHDEKSWKFVKFGQNTVFKRVAIKPKKDNRSDNENETPIQLVLRQFGNVKIGDSVYVSAD